MAHNHPEGLDESVLVGDGGRSWFKTQQRDKREHQHKSKQNNSQTDKARSSIQNDQHKLLTKQQKNRLKRQKKKQRKQQYKGNTSERNPSKPSKSRSDFLYGTTNTPNNDQSIDANHELLHVLPSCTDPNPNHSTNPNPYTKEPKHTKHRTHTNTGFKTYVSSSNQEELNRISAQMLRAKLQCNTALYDELETKLKALRSNSFLIERRYIASASSTAPHQHKDTTSLPQPPPDQPSTDNNESIELITDSKITKQLHALENTTDNKQDDIHALLKKERNETATDSNRNLLNNKNMKKIMNMNNDDQFDSIDTEKLLENADDNPRKRKRDTQKEERQRSMKRARLISQHKHKTNWLNACHFCTENEEKHNNEMAHCVVFYGKYMYLAVPKQECLVPYECVIVPNMHLKSFREGVLNNEYIGASKEEQWAFEKELFTMQKMVCKMFKTKCESGVVFIETVRNLKKNYHSVIHCYPLEFEMYTLCPTYFQKSILESDVMWSTNKRIVEISKVKPLNKAIPHFMSYFYVQFGLYDGYAHIIEDETKIKQDFGPQIIAGIVGEVLFKIKNESYQKQMERAQALKTLFEPFKGKLDAKLNKLKPVTVISE